MEDSVLAYGAYYIFFTIIIFLLFRKYMYSIFDPFVFVILIMSSSLCLVADSYLFLYILIGIVAFYLGCVVVGVPRRNLSPVSAYTNVPLLEVFTIFLFLLYIFVNFLLYRKAQIPLFSDNATESKTAIFEEGTGWIRRILFFSNFLPIALMLLLVITKKRILYGLMLLVFMAVSVLLGSKSSFLGIILVIYYLFTQGNIWNEKNYKIKTALKRSSWFLAIAVLAIICLIVTREAESQGDAFIFSLGFRLMEFGDAMLYYKTAIVRDYFSHYNLADFVATEFNGPLGMLRIVPYTEPLGYQMVSAYWGKAVGSEGVILGPNTIFLVRGHIFFGYVGGVVYCFFIGVLFSFIRKKIIGMKVDNIFIYAVFIFIFFNADEIVREFSQWISSLFDFIIFTFPFFIGALLLTDNTLTNRLKAPQNKAG